MQSVILLSVILLSITMLSVTMLSVVASRRLLKISLVVKFEETKNGERQKKFFWSKKLENKNKKTETTFGHHHTLPLDAQHYSTQNNDTQHNSTQNNDTSNNNMEHNGTQNNNIQYKRLHCDTNSRYQSA
jgi:hypothetical protein